MSHPASVGEELAVTVLDQIEILLLNVERAGQALEVDPHRQRLFELFVLADAAGFLHDDAEHDLSSDGVARALAGRWEMARSLGGDIAAPSQLPPAQLAKMRVLWSFMRMWMEWTYAWSRWEEFHSGKDDDGATGPEVV